jgi:hypothetical protein
MRLTNLKVDPAADIILKKLTKYIEGNKRDLLWENYVNIDLSKFEFFSALVDDDNNIISMAGVEVGEQKWGPSLARIMGRYWIRPDYRNQALIKFWGQLPAMHYKPQIEWCVKNSIPCVFFSREKGSAYSAKRIADFLESQIPEIKFTVLEGTYNVCKPMPVIPESCCQLVIIAKINQDFDIDKYISDIQMENKFTRIK